ncbi:MAG: type I-B CRISPR-associated protein Cas5b [Candidatus Bipolaricaulota bacterium]|nr:type I-B CRISPR-associated protein Cas5b [Candidatus Bipolaricaulota bacterium]MDW8127340.1 type I-B CRISPR-associated protein Cas5b [Candidatus Bipolaricaulota bacterium]
MKVVAFDIWGDYAHFRRFFTTVSALTYSFPPPTTVRGILGAILGFSKEEYLAKTGDFAIGIRVLNPVKRVWFSTNFIFTKGPSGEFEPSLIRSRKHGQGAPRTQVRLEYLRFPRFRLYVGGGQYLPQLEALLQDHRTHFTVSLGLSELLADFQYVGTYLAEPLPADTYPLVSVFPVDSLLHFPELTPELRLAKETVPIYLGLDRTPILFQDVVVELQGHPICVSLRGAHRLDNGEVVYLWAPASMPTQASSSRNTPTAPSA